MPCFLRSYLEGRSLRSHLLLALALAFVLRCLTAYFVYGPMAIDDYIDGILPARQLAHGNWPEIPPGRSYLLVGLLAGCLKLRGAIGFGPDAVAEIRWMGACLGLFSLGVFVGAYCLAVAYGERVFGALLFYLLAGYFLMPFAATRAFGESVSIPWVMLGCGFCELGRKGRDRRIWAAGMLCLGVATLFRFQNGVLFLCFAALPLLPGYRGFIRALLAASLLVLFIESAVDIWSGRGAFSTVWQYLKVNRDGATAYGVQPWYTHFATLLALTFAPFSFVLMKRGLPVMRRCGWIAAALSAFVLIHSIIPHKEERFLFPILPLILVLLASAWVENEEEPLSRRVFAPVFLTLNLLLLGVVSISNSQASDIEPVVEGQKGHSSGTFFDTNTNLRENYLSAGIFLKKGFSFQKIAGSEVVDIHWVDHFFSDAGAGQVAVFIAGPEPDGSAPINALADARGVVSACGAKRTASSLTDRIIFRVNPRHNWRRRPIFYVICGRSSSSPGSNILAE